MRYDDKDDIVFLPVRLDDFLFPTSNLVSVVTVNTKEYRNCGNDVQIQLYSNLAVLGLNVSNIDQNCEGIKIYHHLFISSNIKMFAGNSLKRVPLVTKMV